MSYYYQRTDEFELLNYDGTLKYFQNVARCYLESILTLADSNQNVTNINSKNIKKLVLLSNMLIKNYEINKNDLEPDDGPLIQSWISLGAVLEGCLQCFLKIHFYAYENNPVKDRYKKDISIEKLKAFQLIEYFFGGKGIIKTDEYDKNNINNIRIQRNFVHLFAGDVIDDWDNLNESLKLVIEVILDLLSRLPEYENEYGSVTLCDPILEREVYNLKHKYFVLSRR